METKKWYQSRTIISSVLIGIAGIIGSIQIEYPEIAYIAIANTVIQIILRTLTDKPLG